jgi:NAD(P)-dependent dehydrogenase (short-subunit alcohol dehydrogenase family)/pimeloyl-ACP methyl ester carboxylesterase
VAELVIAPKVTGDALGAVVQRRVDSGDVSLCVYERGPADAPTLVLVHGYPDSSAVWQEVAARLAERYHVVTYDVRGAGRSTAPADPRAYSLDSLATDLCAVIDATSPDRPAHVVGHDWGAIQSWEAVTDPVRARRIASFTAISGPCLDHIGHWLRDRLTARPKDLGALAGQVLRSWYIGVFQVPGLPELAWNNGAARSILRRLSGEATAAATADGIAGIALYQVNVGPRLRSPRVRKTDLPVQVIEPSRDRFVSPALYDDLGRWAPNHFRRRIEAGHWAPRSHPTAVSQAISELVEHAAGASPARALAQARPHKSRGSFDDKLVVVTGAGSGIGRATALAFAEKGADVVCSDLDQASTARTARLCSLLGAGSWAYRVDVSDPAAMTRFAADVQSAHGVPDIVVNNAGIGLEGSFFRTSLADWDKILGVNLYGVIHGCRLFGQQMVDRGQGGHIVNIASGLAYAPAGRLPAYCTTKAAVLMLSECLGAELHPHGIGVSAICPGIVDTGITQKTTFAGADEATAHARRQRAVRLYRRRAFPPEGVAKDILCAVEKRIPVVPSTPEAKLGRVLARLSPSLLRWLARADALAPR